MCTQLSVKTFEFGVVDITQTGSKVTVNFRTCSACTLTGTISGTTLALTGVSFGGFLTNQGSITTAPTLSTVLFTDPTMSGSVTGSTITGTLNGSIETVDASGGNGIDRSCNATNHQFTFTRQ